MKREGVFIVKEREEEGGFQRLVVQIDVKTVQRVEENVVLMDFELGLTILTGLNSSM